MSVFHEDYNNLRALLIKKHHYLGSQLPASAPSVVCTAGSGSGDNYMSIVKRIRIEKPATNATANNYVSLIIKRQVVDEQRRKLFRFDEIFNNEIQAYNQIVPYIKSQLPSAEVFLFPKCYFAGKDHDETLIIILEDLREIGFSLFNRQTDMDLDVCKVVVKQLAKMHAASLVASVKDAHNFNMLRGEICDVVYSDTAEALYSKLLKSSLAVALFSLELSNTDGSLTEPIGQLELLRGKVFSCMRNCVLRADKVHSVICHGDLWVNNIMVKGETKPTDIKFVDLQALRYGSPVFDILHVIYTATRRELREQHTEAILKTYCETLAALLDQTLTETDEHIEMRENLKASFSLQNITDQYNSSLFYGLGVSMWILPACTFDPANLPNIDNIAASPSGSGSDSDSFIIKAIEDKLTDRYHARMKETVLEFHQNGCLQSLIEDLRRSGQIKDNAEGN